MLIEKVKINKIKLNSKNPRIIKDDKFKKLVKSIQDFPEMLEVRPIVVDDNFEVLGGNMRLKACKEAGLDEVHIIKFDNLSEEKKKEFLIKDNVGYGEWDWEILNSDWNVDNLVEWGLDIPSYAEGDFDLGDFFDENANRSNDGVKMKKVIAEYNDDDYERVSAELKKLDKNVSRAIWIALKIDDNL